MAFRLLVALVLITACQRETATTSPSPTPAAARPDVCAMLTVDELNTAAGLKDATGQSSTSGGADVCTWTDGTGKTVVVQVSSGAGDYDQARTGTPEDVTGVGDKAFFVTDTTGGTLVAAKGTKTVRVQVTGGTGDPNIRKGEATAIAHVVLTKV